MQITPNRIEAYFNHVCCNVSIAMLRGFPNDTQFLALDNENVNIQWSRRFILQCAHHKGRTEGAISHLKEENIKMFGH